MRAITINLIVYKYSYDNYFLSTIGALPTGLVDKVVSEFTASCFYRLDYGSARAFTLAAIFPAKYSAVRAVVFWSVHELSSWA